MSDDLKGEFEDFLKADMTFGKKKPSLEEVFQKTLDITTPTTPGHLQSMRKHQDSPKNDFDEWIE